MIENHSRFWFCRWCVRNESLQDLKRERHKSLFNIGVLFGTRLDVWNFDFFCEFVGCVKIHNSFLFEVALVSNYHCVDTFTTISINLCSLVKDLLVYYLLFSYYLSLLLF